MQLLDPQDPRRPNEQIAAAIRAAILTGELKPGERLPSGEHLADHFGVTRATVANAMRKLADEGFVRSVTGSGVYVRDQASLPGPEDGEHVLAGVAAFLFEMGHLKNLPRAGWLLLAEPSHGRWPDVLATGDPVAACFHAVALPVPGNAADAALLAGVSLYRITCPTGLAAPTTDPAVP